MASQGRTASLSRSSSMTSESDIDNPHRRSHKSFNQHQLMLLDNLWHRTARPTREERDLVAQSGGMTEKSVATWFQSRRHAERKIAPHKTPKRTSGSRSSRSKASLSPYPSLDLVASRTERPDPKPTPRASGPSSLYDNMPSSPIAPSSPPPREYVAFGRVKRSITLEWACARSRLVEKEKEKDKDAGGGHARSRPARLVRATTWSELRIPNPPPSNPPPHRGGSTGSLTSGYKHYALPPPMEAPTRASSAPDADTLDAAFILCGMVDERPLEHGR
ncbi:hypothetical protein CYLTODRAFT_491356 [Cylindrobasidium torrendii FP15055 ss-10]|uniref:Homeobox domain-containing protein n=1 Tax=Cylindrobasidium torrendii FP15055 ss-10 TaxID=1314674 RepID=A0A0D7B7Q0_9AGAR|nr:hypothetical protein CYLTODRAFT_491356 [Cylindrobasidium torrendii FP15055 ss-10]